MSRTMIFFMAFMVSFMTIYSVYYYSQKVKLDSSVVALAKDLPHTCTGVLGNCPNDKNEIIWASLSQALDTQISQSAHNVAAVPDEHFVAFKNSYTKANLEKFYEKLVSKFQNHPPIDFTGAKEGDKVLLAYFFYNIHLPAGFRVSAAPIDFHGVNVKALQYHPMPKPDSMVAFYKNDSTHEMAFKIKINGGKEELVMYNSTDTSLVSSIAKANSIISHPQYQYHPAKDESVLIPELDFNIIKDYDFEERKQLPVIHDYTITEERIKLKISAPATGGPMEVNAKYNTIHNFVMRGNVVFLIKEAGKPPYCTISLRHPEILKLAKGIKTP